MRFYNNSHSYYCGIDLHARMLVEVAAISSREPGFLIKRCLCAQSEQESLARSFTPDLSLKLTGQ